MLTKNTLRTAVALAALLSLAGCSGSTPAALAGGGATGGGATGGGATGGGATGGGATGGGATGGGATGGGATGGGAITTADFDAKNLSYIFAVPTQTALSGSADYTGKISVLTSANDANATEAVIGDLDMNVNFGAGVAKPVTATAGNFAGNVDGVATRIVGTLTTANAIANDVNSVDVQTSPVGTLTNATATLRGTVSDPTGALSGDARMILSGNFKEAGGAKLSGGHQTTITPAGGGSDIATGGSLFADKD